MMIVVCGGGSGGHITPLLAVAAELKQAQPEARIVYIGQTGDRFVDVVRADATIDAVHTVFAGKFRRYHGEGLKQLLDVQTMLLTIRDFFLVLIGLIQSWLLLLRLKPQVLFVKGGYIGVPVGLATASLRVPYVTHDSDAVAGLANRIIARWARVHAVALPKETYTYPPNKTVMVGVPTRAEFTHVNAKLQAAYKAQLGLKADDILIVLTGGGLGAQVLNEALTVISPELLEANQKLHIVHTAGHKHAAKTQAAYEAALPKEALRRVDVRDYIQEDMHVYTGAADVVIARAGATSIAELAAQAKALVIVPSPNLAGGHQLKNARAYAEAGAVEAIDQQALEAHPEVLLAVLQDLVRLPRKRALLGGNLHRFARPDSSRELARIILEQAGE